MAALVKSTLLLLLASLLAACGFQLRGQGSASTLPYSDVFVSGNGEVATAVRNYLQSQAGYRLGTAATSNGLTITMLPESRDRKVSSINSSGQVAEYRLTLRVPFSASSNGETFLYEAQVSVSRELSWDDNSVLSKDKEEAMLWQSMAQDAVPLVLHRINAAARKARKTSAEASAASSAAAP
ncbi:LPS-assembly lipoprotein LptE [Chitinilyticum litopenaei]|uniref:LPS-assembly lipoprotein LptE n=1 Tax=Chitinilyticum litopenaei TaxID=1121276 RepID=UPI0003FE5C08|nr:LPS assembly lipoprotein LptE [Chitinilyticum litopenaei]